MSLRAHATVLQFLPNNAFLHSTSRKKCLRAHRSFLAVRDGVFKHSIPQVLEMYMIHHACELRFSGLPAKVAQSNTSNNHAFCEKRGTVFQLYHVAFASVRLLDFCESA